MKDADPPGGPTSRRVHDQSERILKGIHVAGHAVIIVTVLALVALAGVTEGTESLIIALILGALIGLVMILAFREVVFPGVVIVLLAGRAVLRRIRKE